MLVLASTSPYRAELLQRLKLTFKTTPPNCDETPLASESASDLVLRLSHEKATGLKQLYPDALIIGSDQVAERDGLILGKPGNHTTAMQQLAAASGRTITFYTGVCLYNTNTCDYLLDVITTQVHFKVLSKEQIERYLNAEQPYQCAGSFKAEGLGISLFERIVGDDPSAIIGLPLICLCNMLNKMGSNVP